jgi:hypothetical protein
MLPLLPILGLFKSWRLAGAIGLALALLGGVLYVKHLQKARVQAEWDAATARGQLEINDKKAAIDKEVAERKGKIDELEKSGDAAGLSDYFNRGLRRENPAAPPPGDHRPR